MSPPNVASHPWALVAAAVMTVGCGWNDFVQVTGGVSISREGGTTTIRVGSSEVVEGSGVAAEETRPVEAFRRIEASGGVAVEYTIADEAEVVVAGDDNLLGLVDAKVTGGVLRAEVTGSLTTDNPLVVRVAGPAIERLDGASGAQIECGPMECESLELEVGSGAAIEARDLDVGTLVVRCSSGGRIDASGAADEQRVDVSSGGSYTATDLVSDRCVVSGSSGGSARVHAAEEIDASATSGGSVRFEGNPAVRNVKANSAGSVVPL